MEPGRITFWTRRHTNQVSDLDNGNHIVFDPCFGFTDVVWLCRRIVASALHIVDIRCWELSEGLCICPFRSWFFVVFGLLLMVVVLFSFWGSFLFWFLSFCACLVVAPRAVFSPAKSVSPLRLYRSLLCADASYTCSDRWKNFFCGLVPFVFFGCFFLWLVVLKCCFVCWLFLVLWTASDFSLDYC